jgi:hypothetical protein
MFLGNVKVLVKYIPFPFIHPVRLVISAPGKRCFCCGANTLTWSIHKEKR